MFVWFLCLFWLFLSYAETPICLVQEDARADAVDCLVRDIQNTQCLLNVEYSGATCPHVTLQFTDSKEDVGLGLVKEGLVMVDVRKEKHLQKMVRSLTLNINIYNYNKQLYNELFGFASLWSIDTMLLSASSDPTTCVSQQKSLALQLYSDGSIN